MNSTQAIEIVGGGVGGLSLGLALRRSGVPVTILEAGDYPRHRVCGEFISGVEPETIARLGLSTFLTDARPHLSVTYHHRERPLRPFSLPAPAWGISRFALDTRLARAFQEAGGTLHTGTTVDTDKAPPGRVFASGRSRRGSFWIGLKLHVRNLGLASDFEVHLGDRAYVGLSSVETGAVNVCGMFSNRALPEKGVDLLPAYLRAAGLSPLARRLAAANWDQDSFCVTAASLGDRRTATGERVRIGDACATIPAFTGNGLAMAMQGAELALVPLLAYAEGRASWNDSLSVISAAQRKRFGPRLAVAAVLQPFFLEPWRQSLLAALFNLNLIPISVLYSALR